MIDSDSRTPPKFSKVLFDANTAFAERDFHTFGVKVMSVDSNDIPREKRDALHELQDEAIMYMKATPPAILACPDPNAPAVDAEPSKRP